MKTMTPIAIHTRFNPWIAKTYISLIIAKYIQGEYSHIAYLVEEPGGLFVFESSGELGGVVKTPYMKWREVNRDKSTNYLKPVPYINDFNLVVGKDYDYGNVFNRFLEITFRLKIDRDNPQRFTCSELGAWARGLSKGYRVNPQDIVEGCLA